EILQERPGIVDGPRETARFDHVLAFENVQFSYGEGPILHDINLQVRAGESIALVGPSGGGKSTFVDLLLRFYDPTGGRILADGVDIREFGQGPYRRLF